LAENKHAGARTAAGCLGELTTKGERDTINAPHETFKSDVKG